MGILRVDFMAHDLHDIIETAPGKILCKLLLITLLIYTAMLFGYLTIQDIPLRLLPKRFFCLLSMPQHISNWALLSRIISKQKHSGKQQKHVFCADILCSNDNFACSQVNQWKCTCFSFNDLFNWECMGKGMKWKESTLNYNFVAISLEMLESKLYFGVRTSLLSDGKEEERK
jgi:hypothetical protein